MLPKVAMLAKVAKVANSIWPTRDRMDKTLLRRRAATARSTLRATSAKLRLIRLSKSDAGRGECLAERHPSKVRGQFQQLFLATPLQRTRDERRVALQD